ncbi:hypothetical protein FB451DRAFT_48875 [Mycena latifolia]|nr:hypothetical protein FB451DRAFT_48875 [Mycena latifolia]
MRPAHHTELLALIAAHPDLTSSDLSSSVTNLSIFGNSSGSLSMLPAAPQIFHGREAELQEVLSILGQDAAHIVILGTGGMGKTTLATAIIHHGDVTAKYQQRYFVGCHSTGTCNDLVASIASHIGLEKGHNLSRKIIQHFKTSTPSLLVMDNLETVWEPATSRPEVEEFLASLADISHLAILITMRGAERPAKIKWSRPFLAPLKPLSDSAALQTFMEIADDVHEETSVSELLALTDNLPLAVSLIASVAGSEGCEATLSRWKTEGTQLLSDGYDKRSSLDISIMLSLCSSRMTPDAQELLSTLSMLPDGMSDADLVQIQLPIPNILGSKSALLQTTLAYTGADKRLRVLVPIREHVLHSLPPSETLKSAALAYFQGIAGLWKPTTEPQSLTAQITNNLGNINSMLADALHAQYADVSAVAATVVTLNNFYRLTGRGLSPVMSTLWLHPKDWSSHQFFGAVLCERLQTCIDSPIQDPDTQIALGNQFFEHSTALEQAAWHNALATYYLTQGNDSTMALKCAKKALEFTSIVDIPTAAHFQALRRIAHLESLAGDHQGGALYVQKALQCAEALGDILGQAQILSLSVTCYGSLGDFKTATELSVRARKLLRLCGLLDAQIYMVLQSEIAEVHNQKTEYTESRDILMELLSQTEERKPTMVSMFQRLNLALVEIPAGGSADVIHMKINKARDIAQALGFSFGQLGCDTALADLNLSQGNLETAKQIFKSCVVTAEKTNSDEAIIFCLERLGNLNYGMDNSIDTLGWAAIFLGYSMKTKNKLTVMKALHCLGIIFLAQGDDDTALSLFEVALDGFTFMDVHRFRGDCLAHMADIFQRRGDVIKSVELLKAARPLFERSSQAKNVAQIDARLSAVGIDI